MVNTYTHPPPVLSHYNHHYHQPPPPPLLPPAHNLHNPPQQEQPPPPSIPNTNGNLVKTEVNPDGMYISSSSSSSGCSSNGSSNATPPPVISITEQPNSFEFFNLRKNDRSSSSSNKTSAIAYVSTKPRPPATDPLSTCTSTISSGAAKEIFDPLATASPNTSSVKIDSSSGCDSAICNTSSCSTISGDLHITPQKIPDSDININQSIIKEAPSTVTNVNDSIVTLDVSVASTSSSTNYYDQASSLPGPSGLQKRSQTNFKVNKTAQRGQPFYDIFRQLTPQNETDSSDDDDVVMVNLRKPKTTTMPKFPILRQASGPDSCSAKKIPKINQDVSGSTASATINHLLNGEEECPSSSRSNDVLTAPDLQLDWLSDSTGDDDDVVFVHSTREPIVSIDLTSDDETGYEYEPSTLQQGSSSLLSDFMQQHNTSQQLPPAQTEVTSSTLSAPIAAANSRTYHDYRYARRFNEVSSTSPAAATASATAAAAAAAALVTAPSSASVSGNNSYPYDGYRYNVNRTRPNIFGSLRPGLYQPRNQRLLTLPPSPPDFPVPINAYRGYCHYDEMHPYVCPDPIVEFYPHPPQCLRGQAPPTEMTHPTTVAPSTAVTCSGILPVTSSATSEPLSSQVASSCEAVTEQHPPPPRRANIRSPPAAHSTESSNYPPMIRRDMNGTLRAPSRRYTPIGASQYHPHHRVGAPPQYLVHQNLWCRQQIMQEIHRRHLTPPPIDLSSNRNLSNYRSRQMPNICACVHSRSVPVSSLDPAYQMFHALLEQNSIASSALTLRSITVFVPTNEAFQRHHGNTSVLYHIGTVALTQDQLQKTVPSSMDASPPLFITKKSTGDVYVNNARIIPSLSLQLPNSEGTKQVMHVIDEVLVPLTVLPTSKSEITNPDAFQFLQQADSMNIGEFRLRSYRAQVTLMRKESLYQAPGGHTFLIPIDEGFKSTTRSSLVDKKVIDGHVIPNNVIFTAPAPIEMPQTTASFEDNIRVTVSFFQQKDGKMYVKSNTRLGDTKHSKGVVLAEIVKANIPVRNGVVHLIHRPLMIVDTTVTQFLQSFKDNENGALRKFYEVIMDIGGEVLDDINKLGEVTILAPSNEAWNDTLVKNIIRNREKIRDIINMHIIKDRLNVEKIRQKNQNLIAQVPTVNNRTFLYFNINGENSDEVITVEGGGVNATLIQADVAQLNGYVHIIDKVLGVPYTTVLEKLETDPMLRDTYTLSRFSDFYAQLNNTDRRYTFFVPRDMAWQKTQIDYPSVHKKLFMKDFAYHSKSILERHLVISDRTFTMKELATMTDESDSIVLPTFRDSLKMKVTEELGRLHDVYEDYEWTGYSITWNFKKINVYRPDVECTNGIIHVIDYPLLEEKDVVVSGGA